MRLNCTKCEIEEITREYANPFSKRDFCMRFLPKIGSSEVSRETCSAMDDTLIKWRLT